MNRKRYWLKLLLNLTIIGLEVLVIYSGYMLFTHRWEPIRGVLLFLGMVILLVFCWKLAKRHSLRWQRPKLASTTLAVLAVAVVCTFAGIEPLASYKDNLLTSWQIRKAKWEQTKQEEPIPAHIPEQFMPAEEPDIDTSPIDTPVVVPYPQGVYMGTSLYTGFTLIFEGNRLTTITPRGKTVYRYEITQDGKSLSLKDVVTGAEEIWRYKYLEEEDCLILIEGGYVGVSGHTDDMVLWGENPKVEAQGQKTHDASIKESEKQTFSLINQERIKMGLPCVSWDYLLHSGARSWSEHLQAEGELYHDTSGNFAECCYGSSWSSYRTPEQIVEAWMTSSGHRAILLGRYSFGAIGIAQDNGFFATYRCW